MTEHEHERPDRLHEPPNSPTPVPAPPPPPEPDWADEDALEGDEDVPLPGEALEGDEDVPLPGG